MKKIILVPLALMAGLSFVSASAVADQVTGTSPEDVQKVLEASFSPKGDVKLDRLDQSSMQAMCSKAEMTNTPLTDEQIKKITTAALASVKPPADGKYLGDWKAGEKLAQSGKGMQFTDKPGKPNGGNCFACHQMTKAELAFGTIGPSLLHYGKIRGNSEAVVKYTWAKIYNSHAYSACSVMPRFGAAGILTETQIKDAMAFLLDLDSPVNKD